VQIITKKLFLIIIFFTSPAFSEEACKSYNFESANDIKDALTCLIRQVNTVMDSSEVTVNFLINVQNSYIAVRQQEKICNQYLTRMQSTKQGEQLSYLDDTLKITEVSGLTGCKEQLDSLWKHINNLEAQEESYKKYYDTLKVLFSSIQQQQKQIQQRYNDAISK